MGERWLMVMIVPIAPDTLGNHAYDPLVSPAFKAKL